MRAGRRSGTDVSSQVCAPMSHARISMFLILVALAEPAFADDAKDVRQRGPSQTQGDFFERRIRPLLTAQCLACHGPTSPKAGLRLDSREALLRGSESGAVVTPGSPGESPLIE